MRTKNEERYGLWELAVLALLRESPMHPYQMQKLLRDRHKDELMVLKRGSLYHAIHRLEQGALIEVVRTARQGKRPERTTYSITPAGKKELVRWLQQMISTPKTEASDLMAALSFLPFLVVEDAAKRLEERCRGLEAEIAGMTARMKAVSSWVGRINLIESEYLRAMREAELQWVRGLVRELHSGKLAWDLRELLQEARVVAMRTEAGTTTAGRPKKTGKESRS
jgi:DNA-binding PadR family transcriptional regulator